MYLYIIYDNTFSYKKPHTHTHNTRNLPLTPVSLITPSPYARNGKQNRMRKFAVATCKTQKKLAHGFFILRGSGMSNF